MKPIPVYRAGAEITIDPATRQLSFYVDDQLQKNYPVGVGKYATPTPAGDFKIINKVTNPGGVLGTRWMGLNIPGGNYGIHGNNNPSSIGKFVSLGCIRMHNASVEELFTQISVGTPVRILAVPGYNQKAVVSPGSGGEGPPLDHTVYYVRPGDTLWKLAQQFNVTVDALISANNLLDPDHLSVGQAITIPT
ncbi:L,D-transpeptidase family protein [Desulforamulus ruminis]|uniref:ErfK/YbiS/YcfS/YnhG family protein n=1 Tax=Desulforamulus ruminis (strain ATCC 23193 / DSM 2154 / NCIMB 8452 / DL) TaxID=696281 RepID=F6DMQ3_DESRL|nr:L,D-transpeptidase family protein [Desulforamulus ruminis]AEG58461.1 ErfK/YbiS/YcfS/YnhG family protein [Desulforamulus ruminis DSM 2154]